MKKTIVYKNATIQLEINQDVNKTVFIEYSINIKDKGELESGFVYKNEQSVIHDCQKLIDEYNKNNNKFGQI